MTMQIRRFGSAGLTVGIACLATIAGCTARDAPPGADSAAVGSDIGSDSSAQVFVPAPLPAVTDTVFLPATPPRDMPPVAGETKKPIDDPRERDSVTEPQLEVGADGKVRPIRR